MEHPIVIGVVIEASDAARLEVRATNFMLALMAALDQPGVRLEAVEGLRKPVFRQEAS